MTRTMMSTRTTRTRKDEDEPRTTIFSGRCRAGRPRTGSSVFRNGHVVTPQTPRPSATLRPPRLPVHRDDAGGSSCVPAATTDPLSKTTTRSAAGATTLNRCATIKVVGRMPSFGARRVEDPSFGAGVERRRRLVEEQDGGWWSHQRSGC